MATKPVGPFHEIDNYVFWCCFLPGDSHLCVPSKRWDNPTKTTGLRQSHIPFLRTSFSCPFGWCINLGRSLQRQQSSSSSGKDAAHLNQICDYGSPYSSRIGDVQHHLLIPPCAAKLHLSQGSRFHATSRGKSRPIGLHNPASAANSCTTLMLYVIVIVL